MQTSVAFFFGWSSLCFVLATFWRALISVLFLDMWLQSTCFMRSWHISLRLWTGHRSRHLRYMVQFLPSQDCICLSRLSGIAFAMILLIWTSVIARSFTQKRSHRSYSSRLASSSRPLQRLCINRVQKSMKFFSLKFMLVLPLFHYRSLAETENKDVSFAFKAMIDCCFSHVVRAAHKYRNDTTHECCKAKYDIPNNDMKFSKYGYSIGAYNGCDSDHILHEVCVSSFRLSPFTLIEFISL